MSSEDAKSFVAHMLGLLKGANLNTGSLTINLNFDQATGIAYNGEQPKAEKQETTPVPATTPTYTDDVIARAISSINGKDKAINNYQVWLGACCLLMCKYGFPQNLEMCCSKITTLPYKDEPLPLECKYESIRKFAYLKFVREDVDKWDSYQPKDDEKKLFYGCKNVKQELEKALNLG